MIKRIMARMATRNHNYATLLGTLFVTSVVVLLYQIAVITRNQPVKLAMKPPPVPPKDYWVQLWRPWEKHKHNDRILEQREWIGRMSRKGAWDNLPRKNILVFEANSSYYGTKKGQIICHGGYDLEKRCKITKRRSVDSAFRKLRNFDAIVTPHNWIYIGEIKIPYPSMKHVLYALESPTSPYTPEIDLTENNLILASYSSDSDIPVPYGKWVPSEETISPASTSINFAKGKTKLVAMLVSNCNDQNGRLEYVNELNKYIPVDIYGKCGNLNCTTAKKNCSSLIKERYKFYLAFENSNCRDYITEKLFRNAFENNVIPIVMGAHPDDYKAIAPKNSYIHVENFDSPQSLAMYLKQLNKNDDLYNDYFKWKGRGRFIDTMSDFFCRVCGMLYYSDYRLPPVWQKGSTYKSSYTCLERNQWYWDK